MSKTHYKISKYVVPCNYSKRFESRNLIKTMDVRKVDCKICVKYLADNGLI